jgi:hypothetical protein
MHAQLDLAGNMVVNALENASALGRLKHEGIYIQALLLSNACMCYMPVATVTGKLWYS